MQINRSHASPVRVALIGAGGFGGAHIRALAASEANGIAKLTDIIDPAPEAIPEVHETAISNDIHWHRSWEEFVSSKNSVDAVSIAAPIQFHLPYARAAYESGAYVYLEKPPVPLISQLDELIAMEGTNHRIQVGFGFVHSLQMKTLVAWIRDGRLGDLVSIRAAACWPRTSGYYNRNRWAGALIANGQPVLDGPATNALSHRVNDIMWIASAFENQPTAPTEITAELYRARPIQSYDICSMRGTFPSGATFSVAVSHPTTQHIPCEIRITGTKASAALTGDHLHLKSELTPDPITSDQSHVDVAYKDFFTALQNTTSPIQSLNTIRPYVATTNAMFVSAGEIHSLPESAFTKSEDEMYHVDDLASLTLASLETGKTFSEIGAPWAKPASVTKLDDSIPTRLTETLNRWVP